MVHPLSPLEDILEKVPTGHGKNFSLKRSTMLFVDCHRLYPEARRAEIKALLGGKWTAVTLIASGSELIGFLGETIDHILGKKTIKCFLLNNLQYYSVPDISVGIV